jgi:quinol-cytochrome oxidoreductase complex cytochrome b subunit
VTRRPNLGLLALVVAAGGLLSGPFLALNYAPTLDAAHDSVRYIQDEVALGSLLRGLHHWSANFAIVLAFLHGWRLLWHGAYKRPGHMLWVIGGGIFLVLVGFGYTGYLLTGDERAYTGMTVMEQVAGSTPVVGGQASALVKGGAVVSSATLTRLYVVHTMVLPGALVALVVAFVFAARRKDAGNADAPDWKALLGRDATAAAGVCAALFLVALLAPPALGPKPDFGGAGAEDARPEWFFLWVNQLLHMVPGAKFLVAGVLPGVLVGLGLGLPWIARGKEREPGRRKPELIAVAAVLAAIGVLTVLNIAQAPEAEPEPEEPVARQHDGSAAEPRGVPGALHEEVLPPETEGPREALGGHRHGLQAAPLPPHRRGDRAARRVLLREVRRQPAVRKPTALVTSTTPLRIGGIERILDQPTDALSHQVAQVREEGRHPLLRPRKIGVTNQLRNNEVARHRPPDVGVAAHEKLVHGLEAAPHACFLARIDEAAGMRLEPEELEVKRLEVDVAARRIDDARMPVVQETHGGVAIQEAHDRRSHDSTRPGTRRKTGCAASLSLRRAASGERSSSLVRRCFHSYLSWPSVAGMRVLLRTGPSLDLSNA